MPAGRTAPARVALVLFSMALAACEEPLLRPPAAAPVSTVVVAAPVATASATSCPPGQEGAPPACKPLPDADGDGVADRFDACPGQAGTASIDSALHGCPSQDADTDKDGVPDSVDACPREAGPDSSEAAAVRGCPKHARFTGSGILLLTSIFFSPNKNSIQAQSMVVMDDLAIVLNAHPEIKLLEIQGHTNEDESTRGARLSQKRAEAVRDALVSRGVATSRLVPKGYGLSKPLAMPDTPEGKSRNPRIEFQILERGPSL